MKATGIVRRIDDLGRVVIPKEIRRTQRIRKGDALEIFTTAAGEVIFKKYSPMGNLEGCADHCAQALQKTLGLPVLVCDRDCIVAAAGQGKRDYMEKQVSIPLERIMNARRPYYHKQDCAFPCEGAARYILAASPVLEAGDVAGAVMVLGQEKDQQPTPEQKTAVNVTAGFLAKQMED